VFHQPRRSGTGDLAGLWHSALRPKVEQKVEKRVEKKVDQRDKLLAEWDAKTKKEWNELLDTCDAKTRKTFEAVQKVVARERIQREALESTSSATRRRQTNTILHKIEVEKERLLSESNDPTSVVEVLDRAEQERREIIMTFPRPGDPKYVRVKAEMEEARVLSEKEIVQRDQKIVQNAIRENNSDPQRVADQYVQRLIERGTLQSAESLGMRRAPSPDGMWLDANPATGGSIRIRIYDYKVRYVSKAGLVNERVCGVGLAKAGRGDGSWEVTFTTKFGTLIGLP
jgi:hypothetical protein